MTTKRLSMWDTYPHPGKYEGEPWATFALHRLDADEELGDSETFGYYSLYVNVTPSEMEDDEGRKLLGQNERVHAILHEGSQGFVDGTFFDSAREAELHWKQVEKDYDRFMEEEEEDYDA